MKRITSPIASENGVHVKVTDFRVINFHDDFAKRPDGRTGSEIVLIYALGEDGVIREFSGGKWTPFPIVDPSRASRDPIS